MGSLILVLGVVAVIGGVIWNHKTSEAAMGGVEFTTPEPPDVVCGAIFTMYCGGAKAKVKSALSGIKVTGAGPNAFRFVTKLGDEGEVSVNSQGAGSVVEAHTNELYVGTHPKTHAKSGWFGLAAAIVHRIYKLLGIAPYAAKMKRFQHALEGRIARQLGRTLQAPAPVRPTASVEAAPAVLPAPAPERAAERRPAKPGGWYADPSGQFEHRYFDGAQWTEHVVSGGLRQVDPVPRQPASARAASTVTGVQVPAMETSPRQSVDGARRLEQAGDVTGAVAAYRVVIAGNDPLHAPAAACLLGELLERQGDGVGAEAANRVAIASGMPEVAAQAHMGNARLRLAVGNLAGAERAYEAAAALGHPEESPRAAANLGSMREDRGDHAGAIEAYHQAIASGHPDHGLRARVNLGLLLQGRGDLAGAEKNYRMAIDLDHPEEAPRGWLLLGYLYQDKGDEAAAVRAFERAVAMKHPLRSAAASGALGAIRMNNGDVQGAAAAFQYAVENTLDPVESARAAVILGLLRKQVGDREAALAAFRHARTVGPPDIARQAAQQLAQLGAA